jgi:hypothetical protein
MSETFTMVNAAENEAGKIKVSGAYFGGSASIDNGVLVNIKVLVKTDATSDSALELIELKDDISGATTVAGKFEIDIVVPDPEVSGLTPSEGDEAGGTTVTITGNNFIVGTAATVMFGANEATEVNVVSATEINCKSPAGTETVNVSVTQDGKTSNTAQFKYTTGGTTMTLTPGNITGKAGDELTIPITISNLAAAFDSTAFGFTLQVDSDVLEYASIDKSGTMSETFTMVNAAENEAGKIKVSGAYFGGSASIDNGVLVKINLMVKTDALSDSTLELIDLKDDIQDANIGQGNFDLLVDDKMMVYPADVQGESGSVVIVPIRIEQITNSFDSTAFGFTLKYNSDILSFDSVDKSGTLSENFTMVNGAESTPGETKVSGAYFGGSATMTNGLLVNVLLNVKTQGTSVLSMVEFKDDIANALTKNGTFEAGDEPKHSADYNPKDNQINLSELLRVIQIYNFTGTYYCKEGTEDGYMPGFGEDKDCGNHSSDYTHDFTAPGESTTTREPDWSIDHSELQRMIQFYNYGCYKYDASTEDHFKPVECQ